MSGQIMSPLAAEALSENTPSPDKIIRQETQAWNGDTPQARAFSVVAESCVVSFAGPHETLHRCLRQIASVQDVKPTLKTFRCKAHAPFTERSLDWIQRHLLSVLDLGEACQRTQSGSVWKNIKHGKTKFSIIAFGSSARRTTVLPKVIKAFGLTGRIFVEYRGDNIIQDIYIATPRPRKQETRRADHGGRQRQRTLRKTETMKC